MKKAVAPQVIWEVTGLGSCVLDYFAPVSRLIQADQKITAPFITVQAGGVTANNLVQTARLGLKSAWFGLIGEDQEGDLLLEAFKNEKMDISGILRVSGKRSSFAWIPVDTSGNRCIYMFPNVTATITSEIITEKFKPFLTKTKHFHTEASQIPLEPVLTAIKIAKDAGVKIFFDLDVSPQDTISGFGQKSFKPESYLGSKNQLEEIIQLTNVLKPCQEAALQLTQADSLEEAAFKLLQKGPEIVVITAGSEGCLLASKEKIIKIPAFKVNVVDTTGAGDAFMGGLSYAIGQNWELEKVGKFANACAALCCTQIGARACPDLLSVQRLLKKNV